MKLKRYKIVLSAVASLITCFTVYAQDVKVKTKSYTNSVPVSSNNKLKIQNQFGQVVINTWDKNEFKVDVAIKAYANSDAEAQKLLNAVNIDLNREDKNGAIAFLTDIKPINGSWEIRGGSYNSDSTTTNEHKLIITYDVYMPANNPLTINNKFGDIILPSLEGKLNISNSFGNVVAKSITNNDNVINVKYGSVNIENLAGGNLNVSFGSLNIKLVDNLNADIRNSPVKIGRLVNSGNINVKYNTLQIDDIDKDLKSLKINSTFAPVKIKLNPNLNADFDVTTRYTSFSHNNVSVTSKTPANKSHFNPTKNYKGHIGKGSADKIIIIKADYGGGVKFGAVK